MKKLIQLELKGTGLRPYVWAAAAILAGLAAMGGLLLSIPAVTASMGEALEADDALLFSSWDHLLPVQSVLAMAAFSILAAVMGGRFVVSEYGGKQVILLFSYPVPRRAVLLAKCLLVFGFPAAAGILVNLAVCAGLGLSSNLLGIVAGPFGGDALRTLGLLSVELGVLAGAIGLLSLTVGFGRRTTSPTIVAGVVLACAAAQMLSAVPALGLSVTLGALALAMASVLWLSGRVERMEAAG